MSISNLKRMALGLATVLALMGGVYGVHRLLLDPELAARNQRLADELSRLSARNRRLVDENGTLKAELGRLRAFDTESVHHARTELGMVRPGEVVYRFPASATPETPAGPTP